MVKIFSLGSGSRCTFPAGSCQNGCEMLHVNSAMILLQIVLLLQFPEQQNRTGGTYVLSDLDREASNSVCRWERSVTQTAWAPCLAQAVTRTTSPRSKLITAQNKSPSCLSLKKSSRVMGEKDKTKKRQRHRFDFKQFLPRHMESSQGHRTGDQRGLRSLWTPPNLTQ